MKKLIIGSANSGFIAAHIIAMEKHFGVVTEMDLESMEYPVFEKTMIIKNTECFDSTLKYFEKPKSKFHK